MQPEGGATSPLASHEARSDPPTIGALIGDVVGSRRVADRAALQESLQAVLDEVTSHLGGSAGMTIGDEFQGRYTSLEDAVEASLRIHLGTRGLAPVRIGLGWGPLLVDSGGGGFQGQDGPAWWRARDALDRLAGDAGPVRTVASTDTPRDGLLNAYLGVRDTLMGRIDDTDAVICLELMNGSTQRRAAERLGLHESSVSRRVRGHGLTTLVSTRRPPIVLPEPS